MITRRTLALGSGARFILASLGLIMSSLAQAEGPPLPILKHVGVIPVSWDASLEDVSEQRSVVASGFSQAVRSAHRFQVLSDDITKELWETEEGRKQLKSNYELSAFAHLGVARRGDAAALEMRLMSPNLENYIVEADTVPLSWLARADGGQIQDRLESLVYRVFNRIPIDVSVTSVQGAYITISGGEGQGLRAGDDLTFYRVTIASQHPANGSWTAFETTRLGTAKIVEVKRTASVAELTEQTFEGAIKFGDGAKVAAIATRRKFAPAGDGRQEFQTAARDSALVPPIAAGPKTRELPAQKAAQPAATVEARPAPEEKPVAPAKTPDSSATGSESKSVEAAPTDSKIDPETPDLPPEKQEDEPALASSLLPALAKHFTKMSLGFGPRIWSGSGSASAGSTLPVYMINHTEMRLSQKVSSLINVDYRGTLGFGPTGKGSFYGFGMRGDVYGRWDFKNALKPIRYFDAGAVAQYQSLGINGEKFGGYDIISIGALVAIAGKSDFAGKDAEWRTHFLFIPQAMGDAGIKGGKKNVSGVFAFELGAEAVMVEKPGAWEWGAQGYFGSADYSLSSKSLTFTDFHFGALARYRF